MAEQKVDMSNESDLERHPTKHEGSVHDLNLHLVGLQVQTETGRNMSMFQTISAGWIISNSWAGIAATFAIALTQGGPAILIYGPIMMLFLVGSCAVTLAELASVFPTAGGQYHWTSILAPKKSSRVLSYICGAINVFAWIALCVGIAAISAQLTLGLAIFYNPNYVPQPWHMFLIFQASNAIVLVYNIWVLKRTMWIHDVGFFLSISSFATLIITCLARTSGNFQSQETVWATFSNESGWTNGIAFLTGLINPNYMYAGIDGAIHLAEECRNAAVVVPRALMSTISIGFITSFVFAIVMLYCTSSFEAVLTDTTGVPIYEIWRQATRSNTAATIFLISLLIMGFFALNGSHQTASRLTWSFARDNAIIGSAWLKKIDTKQGTPIAALVWNFAIMFIIGCIYLGSTSAFNAFIGTGLILQHVTYAFPAALLIYRKRSSLWLPEGRRFRVPSVLGWIANIVTVLFAVFVLVFYDFPSVMPVKGSNMNYASAVIGVMGVFAAINWFAYASRHYVGPRLDGHM